MKILVTAKFNSTVALLNTEALKEAKLIFDLASTWEYDDFIKSPIVTKSENTADIYTIRGSLIRVFCGFNDDVLLFLDATEVKFHGVNPSKKSDDEITLYSARGEPKAYIATNDSNTIFSFDGRPLAYIDSSGNVYGFNGAHLGWFEDEIIWNSRMEKIGFTADNCPTWIAFSPFKGFKNFKPFKGLKRLAPLKPLKTTRVSSDDFLEYLEDGARR